MTLVSYCLLWSIVDVVKKKNALCCYKITTSFYVLLVKPSIRSHSGVNYWPAGQPFPTDLGYIIQWVNKGVSSKTPRKTLSNRLQQIHLAVQFRMGMKATNSKWGYVIDRSNSFSHINFSWFLPVVILVFSNGISTAHFLDPLMLGIPPENGQVYGPAFFCDPTGKNQGKISGKSHV